MQFGDIVISQIMKEDQRCWQQQQVMTYENKPAEGVTAYRAVTSFPETSRTISNIDSLVGEYGMPQNTAAAVAAASSRLNDNNAYLEKGIINCNLDINNNLDYNNAYWEKDY